MKKTTKFLIAIAFLLTAISLNAQQACAVICHNGTLVKTFSQSAMDGHLLHHSRDVLISTDCEYEIIGNECETLSLPKLNINKPIPIDILGEKYSLYTINGQLLKIGIIEPNFKSTLPKRGLYLIIIKNYQPIKLITK